MIKRSEALGIGIAHGYAGIDFEKILDDFEKSGVEFAPEEPNAVEKWKQPLPESPELVNAREDFMARSGDFLTWRARKYITALESELARLRGGK